MVWIDVPATDSPQHASTYHLSMKLYSIQQKETSQYRHFILIYRVIDDILRRKFEG